MTTTSNAEPGNDKQFIDVEQFTQRLQRLCSGDQRNFPRGGADRAVLLKAASLQFSGAQRYSETQISERLTEWLAEVGSNLNIDPVTLRRHLIDHGYLDRDPAGRRYWVLERSKWLFDPEVDALDQVLLLKPQESLVPD